MKELNKQKVLLKNRDLINKIITKEATIAVIGLGYVGLPTAALFANSGYVVIGIDLNSRIVNEINSRQITTNEPSLKELISKCRSEGTLKAVEDGSEILSNVDVIIVCVQTPVNDKGQADFRYLKSACVTVGKALRKDKFIVIQSTVPPNTIGHLIIPILEQESRLRCGYDFSLAYCPERLSPGTGLQDLTKNTRLIGAFDSKSATIAKSLFKAVTAGNLLLTNISSAEISKLAENSFRFVNIAFANELALLCKEVGVDVQEVIKLANSHPRVNIHQPGCGAGGPCLSKDTQLLISSSNSHDFPPLLIPAAIAVNNFMPSYIAKLALNALKNLGKRVEDSTIVLFGTAYKGEVDDSRNSPSEGIITELIQNHAKIKVFDPNCTTSFGQFKAKNLTEAVENVDCIIIATDHTYFKNLNLVRIKQLMNPNPIIVDGKRIINADVAIANGFRYVSTSGNS